MPVDQITCTKSYKEDATNVNNDMSLGQMLSIQQEAIEMGVKKQVAQIFCPIQQLKKERFKANFILKKSWRIFETEKYKDHPIDYQPLTEKGRSYLKEERKRWLIDYAEKERINCRTIHTPNSRYVNNKRKSRNIIPTKTVMTAAALN
ncbi:LtrC-like protein [Enterococcus faecium]|nr:LtrC-like protein [Enterococcus faecium]